METDSKPDTTSNENRLDTVLGKFGDGEKCMAGVAKNDEGSLSAFTNGVRRVAREQFAKYLGSKQKYVSDICVPETE